MLSYIKITGTKWFNLKALTQYGGKEAKETVLFANIFDKFFNSLNVCNFTNDKHSKKVFQNPYHSGTDFRLKVMNANMHNTIILIIIHDLLVAWGNPPSLFWHVGNECQ